MVKTNVKVYETTEDYTEALSSSRSSSVTFQNMKTAFGIFFCFLTCLSVTFVFATYLVPFFAAKLRRLFGRLPCSFNRRQRRKRRKRLRRLPAKKRTVRFRHVRPCIPADFRRFQERNAFRPGLLSRSIAGISDWSLRAVTLWCSSRKMDSWPTIGDANNDIITMSVSRATPW